MKRPRLTKTRPSERLRAVHEVEVHKIELEAQNRQLQEMHAEAERSRAWYASLYDLAPVAYFTFDAHGVVRDVNRAGAAMLGRTRDSIVGHSIFGLADFESPEPLIVHLLRCETSRTVVIDELQFAVHGRRVTVEATSTVFGGVEADAALRTAFVDVTDRKLAEANAREAYLREQGLRDRLERLDDAFRAMTELLAASGASEEELHRLVVEKARGLGGADRVALGLARREGEPFERWTAAPDEPRVEATPAALGVLGEVLSAPRAIRRSMSAPSPELACFPEAGHLCGAPLRHGDEILGGLYMTRAASERAFTEDDAVALQRFADRASLVLQLARQRRSTEDAIRARDVVLATVSHDLGNPLGSILMSCMTLLRDAPVADRRRTRPLLDVIKRSAERMRRLIEDLMTAATIDSGNLSMTPEPVATRALLDEAARLFRPLTESKSQTLEVLAPDRLPDVRCDRERILQVLANLVGNAIKYSPRAAGIRIEAACDGGEIVVSVADDGPGISSDALPHVFDRHWKGGSGAPGAGLGLYIVREIVRAHGGRVWVESAPGQGTKFSFALAAAEHEGPGVVATHPDRAATRAG